MTARRIFQLGLSFRKIKISPKTSPISTLAWIDVFQTVANIDSKTEAENTEVILLL
jgi:hypothetical protein